MKYFQLVANWLSQKGLKPTIGFLIFSSVAGLALMVGVFPKFFIAEKVSYVFAHDFACNFQSIHSLISDFLHGGIQLWNRFDQVSNVYQALSGGMYTLLNVFTAGVYILLSHSFSDPGRAFHSVFTWVFFGLNILLRTTGAFLLLNRFCRSRFTIFLTLIYFNTILSTPIYFGFYTTNLYSYTPWVCYCLVVFFEKPSIEKATYLILLAALTIANSPLLSVGYFYQGLHFFILSLLVWRFFIKKESVKFKKLNRAQLATFLIASLVGVFILLPYLKMFPVLQNDFELADGAGRLQNIFSAENYFDRFYPTFLSDIFFNSFIFDANYWADSWVFLGASSVFLALCGLFFSADSKRYIFLMTLFALVLLDTKLVGPWTISQLFHSPEYFIHSLGRLVHWMNFTNPFKFLVRSYHMTLMLGPYFLFPLIGLGIQSLLDWAKGGQAPNPHLRNALVGVLAITACVLFFSSRPSGIVKLSFAVSLFSFSLLVFFLYSPWKGKSSHRVAWTAGFLVVLFIIDLRGFIQYLRVDPMLVTNFIPPPRAAELLPRRAIEAEKGSPLVYMDFQNPMTLPLREHFNTLPAPDIREQPLNANGLKFVRFDRFFKAPYIYFPRHLSYRDLATDGDVQEYLVRKKVIISFSDVALDEAKVSLRQLNQSPFSDRLVLVDDKGGSSLLDRIPNQLPKLASPKLEKKTTRWTVNRGTVFHHRDGVIEIWFDLPADVPDYLTTVTVTNDKNYFESTLDGKRLIGTQGLPASAYLFDVNNIRVGKLVISVPENFVIGRQVVELSYPKRPPPVWHNEQDDLGITYQAERPGWLIFHYPYDEKWKLEIDGRAEPIYRVNHYFFGAPIAEGLHKVRIQYWPQTFLRLFIGISILLSMGAFLYLVWNTLKEGLDEP